MFICICNAITDGKIKDHLKTIQKLGLDQALDQLNIGTNCGMCKNDACQVIKNLRKLHDKTNE